MSPSNLKQKIVHEIQVFLTYALFLTLFFCSLTTYHRLILNEYSISYFHYGYGVFQALLLSKMILLGEHFRLGENLKNKPLYVLTLYKTILFSLFVLIFSVLEHFIMGWIHGLSFAKSYHKLLDEDIYATLAKVLVVFFVFILFFAFVETARLFGKGNLIHLFFSRKTKDD